MIETISRINSAVNGFIWGVPAMIALMGVGIYLSIRLKFMQVIKFSGGDYRTCGYGGYGKYSGCCRCNIHRRTGKCILDVGFGNPRYVYKVH